MLRSSSETGPGEDISILDLAELVARVVGFEGRVVTDPSKPDGMPRKLLDTAMLDAMGWRPQIALRQGLADAYRAYVEAGAPGL